MKSNYQLSSVITKYDIKNSIFLLIIALINYSYSLHHFIYNNDSLGRIIKNSKSFKEGISTGRWAYPFFYNIFNDNIKLPIITGVISIMILITTSIFFWKIFDVKDKIIRIIIGAIIITTPNFIHYLYYEGDAEVYSVGIFLITLSIYFYKVLPKFLNVIIPILLITIALACYPALFSFATSLYFFYLVYLYIKEKEQNINTFLRLFISFTFVCISGLALYFLTTKFFQFIFNVEMTNYKGASQLNIISIIEKLPYKIIWIYFIAVRHFLVSTLLTKIIFLINYITLSYFLTLYRKYNIKTMLVGSLILLLSIPFIFSIYLITYEVWPYAGFEFGLIPFYCLPFAFLIKSFKWKKLLTIVYGFFIFSQLQESNKIALEYQLNIEASKLMINNLILEIQKTPEYNKNSKIIFLGSIDKNSNYKFSDIIPNSPMFNGLDKPVGFGGSNIPLKIKNQASLMGIQLNIINTPKDSINTLFTSDFPKEGSILSLNDTILVNLGGEIKKEKNPSNKIKKEEKTEALQDNKYVQFILSKLEYNENTTN